MMIILCDMDGVVADFITPVLARYNRDYNDTLATKDIHSWGMDLCVKPECGKKIYKYFNEQGLFDECPVIYDSPKAIKYLQKQGHEVYFVTKPVQTSQWCILEKMRWVDRYFPNVGSKNIIFTGHKHLVRGDVLIDDYEENLYKFPTNKILVDSPWNQHVDHVAHGMNRIKDWVDIVAHLNKLA